MKYIQEDESHSKYFTAKKAGKSEKKSGYLKKKPGYLKK